MSVYCYFLLVINSCYVGVFAQFSNCYSEEGKFTEREVFFLTSHLQFLLLLSVQELSSTLGPLVIRG